MTAAALFAVRLLASAVVAAFGARKLASLAGAATDVWRPAWMPRRSHHAAMALIGLTEVALALAWIFGLLTNQAGAISAVVTGLVLTVFGVANLARTGRCGCSSGSRTLSSKRLAVRNSALFGAIALSASAGPSTSELSYDIDRYEGVAVGVLVACVVAITIIAPAIQLGRARIAGMRAANAGETTRSSAARYELEVSLTP